VPVARFGDHRPFAQRIQKGRQPWAGRQHLGRQAGQVDQRRVEKLQLAVAVKDRQPRAQLRKGLGQGLHEFAQGRLGLNSAVGGKGIMDAPLRAGGRRHDVEPARTLPGRIDPLALPAGRGGSGGAFEQARQWPDKGAAVGITGRSQSVIGGIGPEDAAFVILLPEGQGRSVAGRAQARQFLFGSAMGGGIGPRLARDGGPGQRDPQQAAPVFDRQKPGLAVAFAAGHGDPPFGGDRLDPGSQRRETAAQARLPAASMPGHPPAGCGATARGPTASHPEAIRRQTGIRAGPPVRAGRAGKGSEALAKLSSAPERSSSVLAMNRPRPMPS
jgi:hypothetical protein